MSEEVAADYVSSLADLTVNSKPHINMLTMLADDNMEHAAAIVKAVEKHLEKVPSDTKLPVLYLIDSIIKNVAGDYKTLFSQNIASTFCNAFEKVDEKTRANLFKLRQTWNDVIPSKKLYLLDTKVNIIDPAWPITAPPPKIHVNPKFLNANSPSSSSSPTSVPVTPATPTLPTLPTLPTDAVMREQLLQKQKKLLELEQEKLRLELLQTKAQLEEQQKILEKQTGHLKPFSEKSQQKKIKLEILQNQVQLDEQQKQITKQWSDGPTSLHKLMLKFNRKDENKIVNKSSSKKVDSPVTQNATPSKSPAKTPPTKTESPKAGSKSDPALKPSIGKSGDVLLKPFATSELNTLSSQLKRLSPTKSSKSAKALSTKADSQISKTKPLFITQDKPDSSHVDMVTGRSAPPVNLPRIAPVSSQLITAARRTRDPRILRRQMEEPQHEPPHKPQSPPKMDIPSKPKQKTTIEEVQIKTNQSKSKETSKSLSHQFKSKSKKEKKSIRQSKEERQNRIYQMVQDLKTMKSQGTDKVQSIEKHSIKSIDQSSEQAEGKLFSKGLNKSSSPARENVERVDSLANDKKTKSDSKLKISSQSSLVDKSSLLLLSPSKDFSSSDKKSKNEKSDAKAKVIPPVISSKEADEAPSLSTPTSKDLLSSDSKLKSEKIDPKVNVEQQINLSAEVNKTSLPVNFPVKDSVLLVNKNKSPVHENVERLESSVSNDKQYKPEQSESKEEVLQVIPSKEVEPSPSSPFPSKDLSSTSDKKLRSEKSEPKVKVIQQIMLSGEVDEASPSPPPPPVISDKFKEVKSSSLSRLRRYGRNREGSESPTVTGDVDLRHALTPLSDDHKKEIVGNAAISIDKDIDLRQFPVSPTKKRPSVERSDAPPSKKSKAEVFDELFGKEDVDLRTLPPPSPPPPPVISISPPPSVLEGKDNGTERSWAKYKQQKPDTFKSPYRYTPLKSPLNKKGQGLLFGSYDNLGRRILCGEEGYGNPPNWRSRGKPYPYNDTDMRHQFGPSSNYDIIIKQAHEQYNSGSLTDKDYKKIVTEVISMNEIRQVEEAQRLDEEELRKEEAYEELEPISDDEISAYSDNHSISQNEDTSSLNADDVFPKDNEEEISSINDEEKHKMIIDNGDKREENFDLTVENVSRRRYSDSNKTSRPLSENHSPRSREDVGHQRDDVSESKESKRERYRDRERERRDEHRSFRHEQKLRRKMEVRDGRMFRKNRYGQAETEVWDNPPFEIRSHDIRESKSPEEMDHSGHGSYNSPNITRPVGLEKGNLREGEMMVNMDLIPPNHNIHTSRFSDAKGDPHEPSLAHPPGPWESSRPPGPWLRNIPPLMRPLPLMRPPVDMQRFGPNRWRGPPPPVLPLRQPFEGDSNVRFNRFALPPNSGSPRPPTLGPGELPPADPVVLDLIATDPTHSINIDGKAKDIRFYGDTAVAMMDWDDPREISFQGGQRRIIIDDRDSLMISFNSPYREMIIDGQPHRVRYGAPTRELNIDGKWYECYFGGPPISIEISGKIRTVQLEGPPPQVRTGVQRKDLVVGKVGLIVDAKYIFDLYLDPKPQRFDIEGLPIIMRFVEALQTVVINGVSFKSDFGGLPKPFFLKGKKHFFRLTTVPQGVKPGYLTIVNMEGGRLQSPPPQGALPAPPQIPLSLQNLDAEVGPEVTSNDAFVPAHPPPSLPVILSPHENDKEENTDVPDMMHQPPPNLSQSQVPSKANPLDMLASLLPSAPATRTSSYSYSVEAEPNSTTKESTSTSNQAPAASSGAVPFLSGEINVAELLQKLIATGIVSNTTTTIDKQSTVKEKPTEINGIIPVDFCKPETLKTRQPGIITAFYSGIQCSSCGVRFPPEQTMKYSQHLDWHFRQNRRDKDSARMAQSRKWYYDISDWIQFEEIEDLEDRAQSWFESQAGQNSNGAETEEPPGEVPSVAAGESPEDAACEICRDKFEQFYNEEREEWHLRQAIRVEEKLYHPLCYQDYRASLDAPIEVSLDESEDTKDEVMTVEKPEPVEDDDDLEVIECEIIQPVFPIEDLTTSDCESVIDETEVKIDPDKDKVVGEEKVEESDITNEIDQTNEQITSEDKGNDATEVLVEDKVEEEEITTIDVDAIVKNIKQEPLDEIMDSELAIKKEREEIDMPETVIDTTNVAVECSIDGNLQFDDSPQIAVSAPPKIKINITKPLSIQPVATRDSKESESDITDNETPVTTPSLPLSVLNTIVETQQPPPPGEEPGPLHLKPRLLGKKLQDLPPLSKGTELSGLCSIM